MGNGEQPRKIAASDALAASVSHGDVKAKAKASGGVALKPGADVYNIDAPRSVEPQQLQVLITIVPACIRGGNDT
jgi:hypothetical protein